MVLLRLADWLYRHCYPLYYPLYSVWKAVSERRERALMREMISPGMIVADIGANIGIYTRMFSALTGATGHVHAFEPAPANFEKLEATVSGLSNVSLRHAAVGAASGTTRLYVSAELNVDHRTFDSGDGRVSIDVPLVKLDDYFSPGQRVDFIKIDVQGYELSVLQGAERVLRENRDIRVFMEFWPYGLSKASVNPSELTQFLKMLNFEFHNIADPPGTAFNDESLDPKNAGQYCNLIVARRAPAHPNIT
ncbi:lipopolysaccharide biosynthesis protein [Rhizobium sp. N122]|uniref:FkbM family methyltransferase n=1 Tax=Rhizobium sp. N122 TaxID=1764272 RepID=UPI000B5A7AD9|nr:FkbM family methyltransferase [Rhizobium sp. N122]OWV72994.1 lipopolysaccharide biosynthesis protein [Rhizobium sp. N122]